MRHPMRWISPLLFVLTLLGIAHGNPAAPILYSIGVEIGSAEFAASQDQEPSDLVKKLSLAHDLVIQSGCLPTDGIEHLIERLRTGAQSRAVYPEILAIREQLARDAAEHCFCSTEATMGKKLPPQSSR